MQQLGKYELLQIIGTGGMGSVYRARLQGPGGAAKEVALKLVHRHLSADRNFVLMFLDEMRVAMAMAHRNIVQTFDAGEVDTHQFMVMELVDGCSLRELLGQVSGPQAMPLDVALFIAMEVAAALGYAHAFRPPGAPGGNQSVGVIHRDVSPANILLSTQGDVKLADFGVAKVAGGLHVTAVHHIKGKLAYMAPEQASGDVEPRSDLFSLGAVLYRMVAGTPIRTVLDLDEVRLGLSSLPAPSSTRPDLPRSLEALILSCLSTDPAGRPANAEELRRALAEEAFRLQLEGGDLDPHARLQAFIAAASEKRQAPEDGVAGRLGAMLLQEAGALATDHGESDWAMVATVIEPRPGHTGEPSGEPPAPLAPAPAPGGPITAGEATAPPALQPSPPPALAPQATLSQELSLVVPQRRWPWLLFLLAVIAGAGTGLALRWHRPARPPAAQLAPTRRDARVRSRADAGAPAPDARPPDRGTPPDQPRPPVAPPPVASPAATLDLNSVPWSQVYIDGRHRGHTPLQGLLVRPGRHRLRLVNPERRLSREIPLIVRPGQRLRRVIELR